MRRSQQGNNNAYCKDKEINWMDWNLLDQHGDIHRFVKQMISLRLSLAVFQDDHGLSLNQLLQMAKIDWHGVKLNQPDWSDHSHSLAFTVKDRTEIFHILLNAYREALEFELPLSHTDPPTRWRRIIDTYLESPNDICSMAQAPAVDRYSYFVQPHSVVLLARDLQA
jgi:glycogen operon protein